MTADTAADPDVPAAAASEPDPSAEAVLVDQVIVGPAGALEPVVEEPAAVQPDAAAVQEAPEGSAADETAAAQVARQPSVAFRLAGQGGAQQVGCGLCQTCLAAVDTNGLDVSSDLCMQNSSLFC